MAPVCLPFLFFSEGFKTLFMPGLCRLEGTSGGPLVQTQKYGMISAMECFSKALLFHYTFFKWTTVQTGSPRFMGLKREEDCLKKQHGKRGLFRYS